MADEQIIDLPSGDRVVYRDSDHSYHRWNPDTKKKGRRLTGVTTVCKALDIDPSNLMKWAAKTQVAGVVEYIESRLADDTSVEDVLEFLSDRDRAWEALAAERLTYDDIREVAADDGTIVHNHLEALANGEPLPDKTGMNERQLGLATAVERFWLDEDPEIELVEQVVYSERLGVAGRLDLLARIDSRDGLGCLDLKTGNYLGASAHAQVGGGYPLLLKESGFPEPDWAAFVHVKADGTYEIVDAEATIHEFEIAVMDYRAAGRIAGAAAKARKARKELAHA